MNTHRIERKQAILAAVQTELDRARTAQDAGDTAMAFWHLERAHVLGQPVTSSHVRVHWHMLVWGLRHRRPREMAGQVLRIVGAATKTAIGWIPTGNTGGANVSPFRPMPIPADLQLQIDRFPSSTRSPSCAD